MYIVRYQEIVPPYRTPFSQQFTQKYLKNAKQSAANISQRYGVSDVTVTDERGNVKARFVNGQEV